MAEEIQTQTENFQNEHGNTQSRKDFLKLSIVSLVGFITVMLGWPLVEYLVKPFYRSTGKIPFSLVPGFDAIKLNTPAKLGFNMVKKNGFLKQSEYQDVWVIKHSQNKATVFSPICPHLGCYYNWNGSADKFMCPCHGSIFSITGNVLGGPAPRPLDTLPHKIEKGRLYVKWERFVVGIPEKVLE